MVQLKVWTWELWSLAGTLACAATLIALLASFNGREVFDWNDITLNTIVSTIAVFMKAAIMYVVAECIGQWKWILLHRGKRKVLDFERVDQASRGPLGCLDMLRRGDVPWLLRLGLIATVLTLAVDPFSQQLVQLDQDVRWLHGMQAYDYGYAGNPYARGYGLGALFTSDFRESEFENSPPILVKRGEPDVSMQSAILRGLSNQSREVIIQQADATCPTGNCTWEPFQTLGVCHRCVNLTKELEEVNDFGDFYNFLNLDDDFNGLLYYDDVGSNINIPFEDRGKIYRREDVTALSLPNGHFLSNPNRVSMERPGNVGHNIYANWKSERQDDFYNVAFDPLTTYSTGNPNRTNAFRDIDTLIWSTSIIYADEPERARQYKQWQRDTVDDPVDEETEAWKGVPFNYWPTNPVQAAECALYYCVKEVDSRFENNVLKETFKEMKDFKRTTQSFGARRPTDLLNEYAEENINPDGDGSLEFDELYSAVDVMPLVLAPGGNEEEEASGYAIGNEAVRSISAFFQDNFRFSWANETQLVREARKRIPEVREMYNGNVAKNRFRPSAIGSLWTDYENRIEDRFESVAISMTNEIRSKQGQLVDASVPAEQEDAEWRFRGEVGITVVTYRVVWYWIVLHGLITLGTFAFCVGTVLQSKDVPVWKAHSLATVSQGSTIVDFGPGAGSMEEMEKRAEKTEVGLAENEGIQLLPKEPRSSGEQAPLV